MIDYSISTSLSHEQAVKAIEEKLSKVKFGVLFKLNMRDKLAEKGFKYDRDIVILEVCNPVEAYNVLNNDVKAGYFLPCKIVVYQQGSGSIIGMIKPTSLVEMLENDNLKETAENVERTLIGVLEELAA